MADSETLIKQLDALETIGNSSARIEAWRNKFVVVLAIIATIALVAGGIGIYAGLQATSNADQIAHEIHSNFIHDTHDQIVTRQIQFRNCVRTNLPRAELQATATNGVRKAREHRLPISDCSVDLTAPDNTLPNLKPLSIPEQRAYVRYFLSYGGPPEVRSGHVYFRPETLQ